MDVHDAMNIEILEDRRKDVDGRVSVCKYAKGKLLGKGGFAKCYLATSMSGTKTTYAIKIVCKDTIVKPKARQKLQTEIKIHKSLRHDNVVKFERFFEDPTNAYMLLELCSNNSMSELVRRRKRLTELEARFYLFELVDALKYLQSVCVIHRDLKLGNLFLDSNMHVKVGDFGLATRVTYPEERKKTICGTPNYIAPEILEGKNGHSYEVDIWSTGVVLYTLIVGKPPYESKDVKSTYKRIISNNYAFPDNIVITDFCKNLIQNMLQTRPENRLSLDEIHSHNFFCHATSLMPRSLPDSTLFEAPPSHLHAEPMFTQNGKNAVLSSKIGDENDPNAINILPTTSSGNERNMNAIKPESSNTNTKVFDTITQERLTSNAKAMFGDVPEWKTEKNNLSGAARRPLKLSDPNHNSGGSSDNKTNTLPIKPLLPAQLQTRKSSNNSLLRGTATTTTTIQTTKYQASERGYGSVLNQFEVYHDSRPQTAATGTGLVSLAATKDDSPIEAHAPVDRIPSRVVQNRTNTLGSSSSAPTVHQSRVASSRTDRFSGQAQGGTKSKTLTSNYLESQKRQLSGKESESLETPLGDLGQIVQEQQQQQQQVVYDTIENNERRYAVMPSKLPSEAWGTVSDRNSIRSLTSVTNVDAITTSVTVQPLVNLIETDNKMNEKSSRNSEICHTASAVTTTTTATYAATDNNNIAVEMMDVQCDDITPTNDRYHHLPATSNNGVGRELGTLEAMHGVLSKNLASSNAEQGRGSIEKLTGIEKPYLRKDELRGLVAKVWVMRYVDYTSKYGLGFLLNTRSAGVYFNDSTKIVQSADGLMFQYIDKKKKSGEEQSSIVYLMTSYPPELQKKVTLLRHFRNYLLDPDQKKRGEGEVPMGDKDFGQRIDCYPPTTSGDRDVNLETDLGDRGGSGTGSGGTELPFIKKWVRTRHAILFRLSNQTVQVVFFDYSEVLLSSEARVVTYVDKNGLRTDHSLDEVLHSDRYDIAKRLKYTKDIMSRLISLPAK